MTDIANEDNALRRLYRAANMSGADVARHMGVVPSLVTAWNQRRKSVGHDKILPLAKLLGVDAATIILATEAKPNGEAGENAARGDEREAEGGVGDDGERERSETGREGVAGGR